MRVEKSSLKTIPTYKTNFNFVSSFERSKIAKSFGKILDRIMILIQEVKN